MSSMVWVAHRNGETLEDTYQRPDPDDDEFGYQVPAALVEEIEAAQARLDAAAEAVRAYIEANGPEEQEIPEPCDVCGDMPDECCCDEPAADGGDQ
jgi:hypothetical protein